MTKQGPPRLAPPRLEARTALTGVAFFLSGASALVYQVAWQRILALQSGVGIYSIAMIVAAFMAGLGAGSYLGGLISARLEPGRSLTLFVLLELTIGAFGLLSCRLYYDVLYLRAAALYDPPLRAAAMHFASLLLPTGLMGMSLPLLVRAMVQDALGAGRTVGFLYGLNLLGASVGALLTPWILIRQLGIPGALQVAALSNGSAGLWAALVSRRSARRQGGDTLLSAPESPAPLAAEGGRAFGLWLALYALSGFCALSLEMLWFRVMDVAVKSNAFTFGTVLSLYLLGSAAGSLLGAQRVERIRRPLRAFLICQCLLLGYAGAALLLLTGLPASTPLLDRLYAYWGSTRFGLSGPRELGTLLGLYVGLPLFLYGPPTALMGLAFPILQRAVQDDARTSGRKVGFLQAANIAGCLAGSLLVGLALLSWLGTTGTLRVLLLAGVLFALVGLGDHGPRSVFAPLAAGLGLLVVLLPGQQGFWLRLHGSADPTALVAEDRTGVVAMTPAAQPGERTTWRLWLNGKSISSLPFGGTHTALGAVPALIHPHPRAIAIVGLGSGDTAWAAGCRRGVTQTATIFEVLAPERTLLAALSERPDAPPKLRRFLADPRMRLVVADGRNAIDRGEASFDVIEMDALFPSSAYAGNLFSVEFFERCARKLRRGGLMCTWSPTPRIRASFQAAFPHVIEMAARGILVGSREPIPIDIAAWRERALAPDVQAYLGASRAQEVFRGYLQTAAPAGAEAALPNRDLFPRDEFSSPD